jgi:hypothetical protein
MGERPGMGFTTGKEKEEITLEGPAWFWLDLGRKDRGDSSGMSGRMLGGGKGKSIMSSKPPGGT